MKITAKELDRELQKGLAPIYLLFGNDPYQKIKAIEAIRKQALLKGILDRKRFDIGISFNWEDWYTTTREQSLFSLFSEKCLWECHLDETQSITKTIGTLGAKILIEYAKTLPSDIILLLNAPKLESTALSSEWFKAIEQKGITIMLNLSRKEMPPSIFDLTDALTLKNVHKMKSIFLSLKTEVDAILVLWALIKKIRSKSGLSTSQGYLFAKAKHIDDIIKGYTTGNAWDELYILCLYLMGVKILDV